MDPIASAFAAILLLLLLAGLLFYATSGGRRVGAPALPEVTGVLAMERKLTLTLVLLFGTGALLTVYFLVEPYRLQAATEAQERISLVRGVETYATLCYACHGVDGKGAVVPGTDPPRVAPALNRADFRPTDPDEAAKTHELIFRTVARGRPNTPMPAWSRAEGGALLDEHINELVLVIMRGEQQVPMVREGLQGGAFSPITGQTTATAPVWEQVKHVVEEKIAHGAPPPIALPEAPPVALSPEAGKGLAYWRGEGACIGCHVIAGMGGGTTGPALSNIGNVAATRKPGMSAEDYIRESLLEPSAYVVQGFQPIMPSFKGRISDEQLNQLVQFYMTLKQ